MMVRSREDRLWDAWYLSQALRPLTVIQEYERDAALVLMNAEQALRAALYLICADLGIDMGELEAYEMPDGVFPSIAIANAFPGGVS